jgi:hypothetical protein
LAISNGQKNALLEVVQLNILFIYSNRDVYTAIALCSKLLHSAIAI